ncbi:hypothetical protein SD457_18255 [Coprobacillaceae bacterium CR2/5/TPMF4]|nr:hypothetical protein SD457_18255 [Coprobacillaceae bacterium CR2/5/TPMF4]
MIELLEKGEVEKIKDGYQVKCEVQYPNDSRVVGQEMIFDKSLAPKQVTVLDSEDAEIITAEFTEFKTDVNLSKDNFNEKKSYKIVKVSIQVLVVNYHYIQLL